MSAASQQIETMRQAAAERRPNGWTYTAPDRVELTGICVVPGCTNETTPISNQGHGLCAWHRDRLRHGPIDLGAGVRIQEVAS